MCGDVFISWVDQWEVIFLVIEIRLQSPFGSRLVVEMGTREAVIDRQDHGGGELLCELVDENV